MTAEDDKSQEQATEDKPEQAAADGSHAGEELSAAPAAGQGDEKEEVSTEVGGEQGEIETEAVAEPLTGVDDRGAAIDQAAMPPSGEKDSRNLDLMMDLPLDVVVELGQSNLALASVLSLGPGSVIELNRRPGEPLDLYVNGHLMARGEVVVLNETFGFRITEIVSKAQLSAGKE